MKSAEFSHARSSFVLAMMVTTLSALTPFAPSARADLRGDDCALVVRSFAKSLSLSSNALKTEALVDSVTDTRRYTLRVLMSGNYSNAYELVLSNDSHDKCFFESLRLTQSGE